VRGRGLNERGLGAYLPGFSRFPQPATPYLRTWLLQEIRNAYRARVPLSGYRRRGIAREYRRESPPVGRFALLTREEKSHGISRRTGGSGTKTVDERGRPFLSSDDGLIGST